MTSQEKKTLLDENRKHGDNFKLLRKVFVLLPVIFTEYLASGIYYYAQSEWINQFVKIQEYGNASVNSQSQCADVNKSDPNYLTFQSVEDKTAMWQLYCNVAASVPSFFAIIILPSYSDTIGRKFLFICGTTGQILKIILTIAIVYFKWGLIYLVLAAAIDGIMGSFAVINSGIFSFLSDVTTSGNQRTAALSVSDALLLTAITVSSLITGYFVKYEGFLIPFCTSLGLMTLQFIIVVCFMPETHKKKNRANTTSVLGNFKRTIEFYSSNAFKGKRVTYIMLIAIFFVAEMTIEHRAGIELLYQLGQPFCWTPDKIGVYGTLRHAAQGIGGLLLLGPMKLCLSDLTIAIISTVFNAGSYVQEAFATTDIVMYLGNFFTQFIEIIGGKKYFAP